MSGPTRTDGLAIAAVSDLLGIPVPTIRSWERRYGYPSPARTAGSHRRYSADEVDQLRALRDAIAQGRPAREAVDVARARSLERAHRDPRIDVLLKAAVGLDTGRVQSTLERLEVDPGIEEAILDVVLPAMQEVGARWKAGVCDVATEHALTDTVRRWLARWTAFTPVHDRQPIVLACGPREMHSVGLEAFGLFLARRGQPVVMLGALTPVEALRRAVVDTRARAAVVVAQRAIERRSTVAAIQAVHPFVGRRTFYGGAAFATASARRGVPGVYLGVDLASAADLVTASLSSRPNAIAGAG